MIIITIIIRQYRLLDRTEISQVGLGHCSTVRDRHCCIRIGLLDTLVFEVSPFLMRLLQDTAKGFGELVLTRHDEVLAVWAPIANALQHLYRKIIPPLRSISLVES